MATKTGSERRTAGGSCFKEVEVLLTLALPPAGLRDINAAVCNHLNQSLMKYVALEGGAGGVLVAYWGVALEGSCARIMYEQPELHCRVRLRALFFAPSPGLTLVGEVNKVGSDHVGLLVAGAFNASVSRDAVPADFVSVTTAPSSAAKDEDDNEEKEDDEEEEDEEEAKEAAAPVTTVECWRSTSDPTRELSPGRFAALQTTAVTTSRGIITIFGSMLAPRTGPLLHVAGEAHESESHHEQHQEAEESEETAVTAASPGSKKKKKEKKEKEEKKKPSKRKAKEEAEEEEEEAAPVKVKEEAKPKTPKKKKRRVSEQ